MTVLRVAVHVHSDWSYDGSWPLERVADTFSRLGYDAVLMAEHDRGFDEKRWRDYQAACALAAGDRLLLIPGIEYSDAMNGVHVPVWGLSSFLGEGVDTLELLEQVAERGGAAVLAHPGRRDVWRSCDETWRHLLLGVEVWNRKYDGVAPSEAGLGLVRGHGALVPFVGLDFHTPRQLYPLAMIVDVPGSVTEATLLASLKEGRCHAEACGLPLSRLSSGRGLAAVRGMEHARSRAARTIRSTTGS